MGVENQNQKLGKGGKEHRASPSAESKANPALNADHAPLRVALDKTTLEYLSITELETSDIPYVRGDVFDALAAGLRAAIRWMDKDSQSDVATGLLVGEHYNDEYKADVAVIRTALRAAKPVTSDESGITTDG